MFEMVSEKRGPKVRTIIRCEGVTLSDVGLRYRMPGEKVHLREEMDQCCLRCGTKGGVWLSSDSSWDLHAEKCVK